MSDGRTTPLAGNYTGSMTSSEAGTTTRSAGVDTLISPTSVSRLPLLLPQLCRSCHHATLVSLSKPYVLTEELTCCCRSNMRRTCTAWSGRCLTPQRRRTFHCCTSTASCLSSSGSAVGPSQDWACSVRPTLFSPLVTSSLFWLISTQLAGLSTR